MAKFDPHRIKTPGPIAKKIVTGGQVGEETRSAKFGANRSTGVFRGDMPIFQLSFFLPRCIYAGGLSDRKRVCLSVRPSVCHSVNCDKTNESSAEILTPHER